MQCAFAGRGGSCGSIHPRISTDRDTLQNHPAQASSHVQGSNYPACTITRIQYALHRRVTLVPVLLRGLHTRNPVFEHLLQQLHLCQSFRELVGLSLKIPRE